MGCRDAAGIFTGKLSEGQNNGLDINFPGFIITSIICLSKKNVFFYQISIWNVFSFHLMCILSVPEAGKFLTSN